MTHTSKTEILSLPEGMDAMYLKIKEQAFQNKYFRDLKKER